MSDAQSTNRLTLGDALRALPSVAPAHDDWPALAAALAPPRRATQRYAWPLALAACTALIALGVLSMRTRVQPSGHSVATVVPSAASVVVNGTATNSAASTARLVQLQQRSRELEHWLRQTGADAAPLPGQDLAAAAEIENLIGLVDVELSAPRQTQALALWQRRVGLLEDLTALRYSNYRLAAGSLIAASTQID